MGFLDFFRKEHWSDNKKMVESENEEKTTAENKSSKLGISLFLKAMNMA
jgi:hypothetical protein